MLEPSCTISCLAVVGPHQLFQFLALPDCNSSQHRKHKQWFIHAHLTVTFLSLGSLPHRSHTGQLSSSVGQTGQSSFAFSPSAAGGVAPVGIEVVPAQRKKRLSQESAVGVRWLLVLSVCLLALDHCESTTFAIFQRLQPRNQPKTLDSAQDLPSNQKISLKDFSAGNCPALKT